MPSVAALPAAEPTAKRRQADVREEPKFAALPSGQHLGGRYGLAAAVQDKSQLQGVLVRETGIFGLVEDRVVLGLEFRV